MLLIFFSIDPFSINLYKYTYINYVRIFDFICIRTKLMYNRNIFVFNLAISIELISFISCLDYGIL